MPRTRSGSKTARRRTRPSLTPAITPGRRRRTWVRPMTNHSRAPGNARRSADRVAPRPIPRYRRAGLVVSRNVAAAVAGSARRAAAVAGHADHELGPAVEAVAQEAALDAQRLAERVPAPCARSCRAATGADVRAPDAPARRRAARRQLLGGRARRRASAASAFATHDGSASIALWVITPPVPGAEVLRVLGRDARERRRVERLAVDVEVRHPDAAVAASPCRRSSGRPTRRSWSRRRPGRPSRASGRTGSRSTSATAAATRAGSLEQEVDDAELGDVLAASCRTRRRTGRRRGRATVAPSPACWSCSGTGSRRPSRVGGSAAARRRRAGQRDARAMRHAHAAEA